MSYFMIHVEQGSNSGYCIPVIADSISNAISTAKTKGMFASICDANKVDSIQKIDASEYTKLVDSYECVKTIVASDYCDNYHRFIIIACAVPNPNFDLVTAAKGAAKDFCLSKQGKKVYSGNCHSFNWGDLDTYVTDRYCKKHGFKMLRDYIPEAPDTTKMRDFDEQLVDESDIFPEE